MYVCLLEHMKELLLSTQFSLCHSLFVNKQCTSHFSCNLSSHQVTWSITHSTFIHIRIHLPLVIESLLVLSYIQMRRKKTLPFLFFYAMQKQFRDNRFFYTSWKQQKHSTLWIHTKFHCEHFQMIISQCIFALNSMELSNGKWWIWEIQWYDYGFSLFIYYTWFFNGHC